MLDFILGHYAYWFVFLLLVTGLYGMIIKKNIVKKVIGMTIFQVSVILFFIVSSTRLGGTVPVLEEGSHTVERSLNYINPLPHTLMLTAIVVGVATCGVAFALIITIYHRYGTIEEPEILKRMKDEPE